METNTTTTTATATTIETLEAILAALREITSQDVAALEDKAILDKIAATAAKLYFQM